MYRRNGVYFITEVTQDLQADNVHMSGESSARWGFSGDNPFPSMRDILDSFIADVLPEYAFPFATIAISSRAWAELLRLCEVSPFDVCKPFFYSGVQINSDPSLGDRDFRVELHRSEERMLVEGPQRDEPCPFCSMPVSSV